MSGPVLVAVACFVLAARAGGIGRRRSAAARALRRLRSVTGQTAERSGRRGPSHGDVVVAAGVVMSIATLDLPAPVLVGLGLVLGTAIRLTLPRVMRRRADRRAEEQLPDAFDGIASSLRRGSSLLAAIDAAAAATPVPLGPKLHALAIESRHRGIAVALEQLATGPGVIGSIGLPLATAVRADADPTGIVSGIARSIRSERHIAAEVDALVAQARLSGLVMAITPLGFAAVLTLGNEGARSFLLGSPAGWACLGIGLTLDALGWVWMRALAAEARR